MSSNEFQKFKNTNLYRFCTRKSRTSFRSESAPECVHVFVRAFSTAEQLGGTERRSDVARGSQDLLPDVEVPVQPGHVVQRGGDGGRASQRLVAERHRRSTFPRHRQRTPRAGLVRVVAVLDASG